MHREPVTSSQIKSIGYDPQTKQMEVEFKSGGVYQYENISAKDHEDLMAAESVGSHFYKNIKPNVEKHPFHRIA
jgi:hypothetical protein